MYILHSVLMLNLHHIDTDLGSVKVHSTKPHDLSWISWDPCDKERRKTLTNCPLTSTPVLLHMWIHTEAHMHTHTSTHTCTQLCKIDNIEKVRCDVCTALFKPQMFYLHLHGPPSCQNKPERLCECLDSSSRRKTEKAISPPNLGLFKLLHKLCNTKRPTETSE